MTNAALGGGDRGEHADVHPDRIVLPPFFNVSTEEVGTYDIDGAILLAVLRWAISSDQPVLDAVVWWLEHRHIRCGRPTKDGRSCRVQVDVAGQACWRHRESR